MKIYNEIPLLEMLEGDTLPRFFISVETTGSPLPSGCTMELIVYKDNTPSLIVLQKSCTPVSGGFSVTLTSQDTSQWSGMYRYCLSLKTPDSLVYRRLAGRLYVHPAAQGGGNG